MKLYSVYDVEDDITHYWKTGYLNLWIKKQSTEWLIACSHDKEKEPSLIFKQSEKPEDPEWTRIISQHNSSRLSFKPSMPDRPVIVQSPEEVRVLERQKSEITVSIPLNLRIYSITEKDENEQLLFELPTEIMSKTWFGELLTGMLAYSLNTSISVNNNTLLTDNYASCKILINNTSKIPFQFRKLSIPVNSMNIYSSGIEEDNSLFIDSIIIEFADEEKIKITVDDKFLRVNKNRIIFKAQKSFQDKYLFKGVTAFIKTVTGI